MTDGADTFGSNLSRFLGEVDTVKVVILDDLSVSD